MKIKHKGKEYAVKTQKSNNDSNYNTALHIFHNGILLCGTTIKEGTTNENIKARALQMITNESTPLPF